MSTRLSKVQRQVAAMIQQIRGAPGIHTAWLPVSYVMAHVDIESGFDADNYGTPHWGALKAGDYAKTGSVGLMQPTAETAKEVLAQYAGQIKVSGLPVKPDMTDPLSNLVVGMLYLYTCRQYLLPVFKAPLSYAHVAVAYNAGPGNARELTLQQAMGFIYYIDWASAEPGFAFLDAQPPTVTV